MMEAQLVTISLHDGSLGFEVSPERVPQAIVISADTGFRSDDADQWVRVERYLRGEIYDLGKPWRG
jgi:hypothetical protein